MPLGQRWQPSCASRRCRGGGGREAGRRWGLARQAARSPDAAGIQHTGSLWATHARRGVPPAPGPSVGRCMAHRRSEPQLHRQDSGLDRHICAVLGLAPAHLRSCAGDHRRSTGAGCLLQACLLGSDGTCECAGRSNTAADRPQPARPAATAWRITSCGRMPCAESMHTPACKPLLLHVQLCNYRSHQRIQRGAAGCSRAGNRTDWLPLLPLGEEQGRGTAAAHNALRALRPRAAA